MYVQIVPLVRQQRLSHEAFVEYWQSTHSPIVTSLDGLVEYHRVVPTEPEHAEFDGLEELYFETYEELAAALGPLEAGKTDTEDESTYREELDAFVSTDRLRPFVGAETVQKDEVGGPTDGLYKHSAFLVRKAGMSHEAFVDYWQRNHTPIAREIEGVVKYDTILPADPETAEFDGVAELYFDDLEKLYDALGSEGSRDYDPERGKAREARQDVDNFLAITERPRFIGREQVVTVDK